MKNRLVLLLFVFFTGHCFAQQYDSVFINNKAGQKEIKTEKKQTVSSFILPATLFGYGIAAIHVNSLDQLDRHVREEIRRNNGQFHTHADDYLQYTPALAVYVLDASGIKARHGLFDRSMLLLLSTGMEYSASFILKHSIRRARPDSSDFHSFPSGHATTAWAMAEFLHQEYKGRMAWYSISGYAVAMGISALRLYNDEHWVSDVIAGAGVGIISTKLAYVIYPFISKKIFKRSHEANIILPVYNNGAVGVSWLHRFE